MVKVVVLPRKDLLSKLNYRSYSSMALISVNDTKEEAEEIKALAPLVNCVIVTDLEGHSIKEHKPAIDALLKNLQEDVLLVVQCNLGSFRSKGIAAYAREKLNPGQQDKPIFNPIYDILMRA